MNYATSEFAVLEETLIQIGMSATQELGELELALVGGGNAGVIIA